MQINSSLPSADRVPFVGQHPKRKSNEITRSTSDVDHKVSKCIQKIMVCKNKAELKKATKAFNLAKKEAKMAFNLAVTKAKIEQPLTTSAAERAIATLVKYKKVKRLYDNSLKALRLLICRAKSKPIKTQGLLKKREELRDYLKQQLELARERLFSSIMNAIEVKEETSEIESAKAAAIEAIKAHATLIKAAENKLSAKAALDNEQLISLKENDSFL